MPCAHEIHGTPAILHPQSQDEKFRGGQKRNQGSLRGIPDDGAASEEAFRSVLSRFLLLAPADACVDETVDVAVEYRVGVADLEVGPQVLDHLVGVEDVDRKSTRLNSSHW